MAIAHVVSTTGGATGTFTTTGVDTTGANLLIAYVNRYTGGGSAAYTISDSKGNTWTAGTGFTSSATADTAQVWYCIPTSVGAGHTVTFTNGGTNAFGAGTFSAFSGAKSSSVLDQQVQLNNNASASTHTATSVTPSEANCLIVQLLSTDGVNYSSINPSYTLGAKKDFLGGTNVTAAVAYLIQTSASASSPTITLTGSAGAGIGTLVFKSQPASTNNGAGFLAFF